MKKTISLLLVLIFCLSLAACDESESPQGSEVLHNGQPTSHSASAPNQDEACSQSPEDENYEFVEPTTVEERTMEDGSQGTFYQDANGKLIRAILKGTDGTVGEFTYNPDGTVDKETRSDGTQTEYHYYLSENLITSITTFPNGDRMECNTDGNGNPISQTHKGADGSEGEIIFGENGQPLYSTSKWPDGSEYEITYGENGQPLHSTSKQVDGYEQEEHFNEKGQLLTRIVKSPDGYLQEEYYDNYFENGIPGKYTLVNPDGERTEEYDENGTLILVTVKHSNGEYSEEHYENGSLICRTSKLSNGNQIETHYENGAEIKYVEHKYNEAGILIQTYISHHKTKVNEYWDYNNEGVLIAYTYSLYPTVHKVYYFDESGTLTKFDDNGTLIDDPEQLAKIATELDF